MSNRISTDWSTLLGSSRDQVAVASIVSDSEGSVIVSGWTTGDFEGLELNQTLDSFISKLSTDGTVVWSKLLNAGFSAEVKDIAQSNTGDIFMVGSTTYGDAFYAKFDSNGSVISSKKFGTSTTDEATSVTIGQDSSVYVAGRTLGNLDGELHSAGNYAFNYDAFLQKYDDQGNRIWTRVFGTTSEEKVSAIASTSEGAIYVVGNTGGYLDGEKNKGAFLTKFDTNGIKVWTRILGTSTFDTPNAVSVATDGSVYVAGGTYGNFDGQISNGRWDAFLTKYDQSGNKKWSKLLGSSGDDAAYGVGTSADGSIYISGGTSGSIDGQSFSGGNSDAFLAKYDSNGNRAWSKIFGTNSYDDANGLSISANSDTSIFVVGETKGSLNGQVNSGGSDAFIIKLSDIPALSIIGAVFSIAENSSANISVGSLTATSPTGKTITFSITSGNTDVDNDGKAAFAINSKSGAITVNDAGDLNYEGTKTFSLTVQASDGSLSSTATATINLTNVDEDPSGSVLIQGTAVQGNKLTVVSTLKDPDGDGTASYQWLRNDVAIANANASTYTLTSSDVAQSIKVRLSYTDGGGFAESVTSAGVTAAGLGPGVSVIGSDKITGEDGNTAVFSVSLNAAPTSNVTLNFAVSDATEGKLSASSLTFTQDNWNTAQTLTVTGVDDYDNDGNVAYSLNVLVSSTDAKYAALKVSSIAMVNNDDTLDTPITKYIGTSGDDNYSGGNGNDVLYSGYGSDVLHGGRGDDSLYGEQNADQLFGDDGNDRLYGGYEADELYGGSGNDELYGQEDGDRLAGGAGNDYLDGGTGADNMIGGVGNDTYFVDNAKDVIDDQGAATDQDTVIVMATITYKLGASVENAELKDVSGAASLTGNTLNNELTGNSSKNTLDGGIGKDVIYAGAGEDTLIGGAGADQLSLGQDTSVDMLVYRAVSESLAGERDRISQFMSKQDKLGLSDMDANSQMAGDQAFAFNGTTAKANAVWYQAAEVDGNKATPDLIVYADVNGDGKADFEVGMVGVAKLAQVDFVL